MKPHSLVLFNILIGSSVSLIGNQCHYTWQCGRGEYCLESSCRRMDCIQHSQCQIGELCQLGIVDREVKMACRPSKGGNPEGSYNHCPGGGRGVHSANGELAQCDLFQQCPDGSICNPQAGVCCTKLRTCPLPMKVQLSPVNGKPLMCQIKGGPILACAGRGYCEKQTGFCCDDASLNITIVINPDLKPRLGDQCSPNVGCDGGAACLCSGPSECNCECLTELGYSISSDGKSCQRVRRRLKEKCKSDQECSAAFSECATGGCRCRKGFQRDGAGGCQPINYRCVGGQPPQKKREKVVKCSLKQQIRFSRLRKVFPTDSNSSTDSSEDGFEVLETDLSLNHTYADTGRDDCDEGFYCVPIADDPFKSGYYSGFCCPSPGENNPVCPVGDAHVTSSYPNYGCDACPTDHYCHMDSVYTDKEICCPKPCVSVDDIYHDGQCYSTAYHGDSCHISAQCQSAVRPSEDGGVAPLTCLKGVCECPAGYSFTDNQCQRLTCSVGMRGEPSVDGTGTLIRCRRSSDCSQGFMCDPTSRVCCKGINRCPSNYVETGEKCKDGGRCSGPDDMCYRGKAGISKMCCRPELTL